MSRDRDQDPDEITQVTRLLNSVKDRLEASNEKAEHAVDSARALETHVLKEDETKETIVKKTSVLPPKIVQQLCRWCGRERNDHFLVAHVFVPRNEDR